MNKAQRTILISGAAIVVLMLLYPPFLFMFGEQPRPINLGYAFLLDPPLFSTPGSRMGMVNVSMLVTEWLAVLIVTGALWLSARDK